MADYDFTAVSQPGIKSSEVMMMYSKCADTYDQISHDIDYKAHEVVAKKAAAVMNKECYILDAAAGTGLVGEKLRQYGFTTLDALDGSQEMLDKAKEKDIYQKYICEMMGPARLPLQDDVYDGVTVTGAFVPGHLKGDCIPELIRVTKPGGYIVITLRACYLKLPDYVQTVMKPMEELEKAGKWKLVEREEIPGYVFNAKEKALVFVYSINDKTTLI